MEKEKLIEEMVMAVYPWLKEVPIEERKQLQENVSGLMVMERLYNAGYRKQEDILHEWVERETAYLKEIAELKKENQRLKELQEKEDGKEIDR